MRLQTGQTHDQVTAVKVSWADLGIDPSSAGIFIPEIKGFQKEQKSVSLDKISIPGKEGFLIVIKK